MPKIMPISELRNYTKVVEKLLAFYRFQLEVDKGERSILEEGTISSDELKKELGL